jgi:hypothetical protein
LLAFNFAMSASQPLADIDASDTSLADWLPHFRRTLMIGEKIYEYVVDVQDTLEYGLSLASILSGEMNPPLHGARFDVHFDGHVEGRISGKISGADFAFMRPDGHVELNIHAKIDVGDGRLIAFWAGGLGRLRAGKPVLDLAENVRLTTSHADYDWVNGRQIWATGTADLALGKISLEAFMQ